MYSSILDLKTPIARTQDEAMFPEQWDGLVGSWPLFEGGGATAFDFSGRGQAGTLFGTPVWTPTSRGAGLGFDGTDDRVAIASSIVTAEPFTMFAWFISNNSTSTQVLASVHGAGASGDDAHYLLLRGAAAGDPVAAASNKQLAAFGEAQTTGGYSAGQLHFACGVWESSNLRRVYLDGTHVGTSTTTVSVGTLARSAMGVFDGSSRVAYFSGTLLEVGIVNVAWTGDQIMSRFRLGPRAMLIPKPRPISIAEQLAAANRRRRLLTSCR